MRSLAVGSDNDTEFGFDDDEPRYVVAYDPASKQRAGAVHPDRWQMRDDVNYVARWRDGQQVAERLASALVHCGVDGAVCKSFTLTDGQVGVDVWVPGRWAAWFTSFLEA
jgi:hypothetical protein